MKKLVALMAAFALVLCGPAALAESDYTYFPESEEYVGIWYVDDYILEIDHTDADYNLFSCIVTQYAEDGNGVRWIYDSCSYDDVGQALASFETGRKFDVTFDDFGELVSSEPVYYTDGAASFRINEDGTLTWTDFKETPGEDERVFGKVGSIDISPEDAFQGTWACDRATIIIESLDDIIYCSVLWSGSAWDVAEWVYEGCTYDAEADRLVTQANGVKTNLTYGEDGEVETSDQIYDDGEAVFSLDETGRLIWDDKKENAGEGMLFEKVLDFDEAIPVDELTEGCFKVIAGVEQGTAGASLKLAEAVCEVGKFAGSYDLSEVDDDNLSVCVLMALVEFSDDEQAAFGQNFDSVSALLDACFEDWDANRAVFEDAGVDEDMDALVADDAARLSWEKLRDSTREILDMFNEG